MTDTLTSEYTIFTGGMLAPELSRPLPILSRRMPYDAPRCASCGKLYFPIHNNKVPGTLGQAHCTYCRAARLARQRKARWTDATHD